MIKCTNCGKEFEVHDDQIIAVSSELMQAEVFCYHCKTEISVKMVPDGPAAFVIPDSRES